MGCFLPICKGHLKKKSGRQRPCPCCKIEFWWALNWQGTYHCECVPPAGASSSPVSLPKNVIFIKIMSDCFGFFFFLTIPLLSNFCTVPTTKTPLKMFPEHIGRHDLIQAVHRLQFSFQSSTKIHAVFINKPFWATWSSHVEETGFGCQAPAHIVHPSKAGWTTAQMLTVKYAQCPVLILLRYCQEISKQSCHCPSHYC